ncbi:structural maintenance of chromosomes protein 6, partial [Kipferlia bialata]
DTIETSRVSLAEKEAKLVAFGKREEPLKRIQTERNAGRNEGKARTEACRREVRQCQQKLKSLQDRKSTIRTQNVRNELSKAQREVGELKDALLQQRTETDEAHQEWLRYVEEFDQKWASHDLVRRGGYEGLAHKMATEEGGWPDEATHNATLQIKRQSLLTAQAKFGDPVEKLRVMHAMQAKVTEGSEFYAALVDTLNGIEQQFKRTKTLHETYRRQSVKDIKKYFGEHVNDIGHRVGLEVKHPPVPHLPSQNPEDGVEVVDDDSHLLTKVPEGTLQMTVAKTETRAGRSAKTLSGGEAGFSVLCLLVASWFVVQPPVIFVDEWDVYLDTQRRSKAVNMMLRALKESGSQAILVSPNKINLEEIEFGDDEDMAEFVRTHVDVQHVKPPERG